MKKLLSLPPNVVDCFHDITGLGIDEYFCTCDPVGQKLGSGGGTAWLLYAAFRAESADHFTTWLAKEKRILLHAGGRSQRLPSYALSGKILMPAPLSTGGCGRWFSQDLLSLQLPLYERMMEQAPDGLHTMVVSGDVLIRATEELPAIPAADVVCFGLELDAQVAKNHGVFVSDRHSPHILKQMLQKPSVETLAALQKEHIYLTDIGVWLLSDRAVERLMKKSGIAPSTLHPSPSTSYDLYAEFGCALGTDPTLADADLQDLTVAVLPLPGGEFYHFGTSREMISSTLAVQSRIDNRQSPSGIIVQNSVVHCAFTAENRHIWIENSYVGRRWTLTENNIVTGVPENDWEMMLAPGECIDVVPVGEDDYEVRRYHIDDRVDSDELSTRVNLRRLFAQRRAFWVDGGDAFRQMQAAIYGKPVAMTPRLTVCEDQMVCAQAPVRIDIAGGWTDTPPYCLMEGGHVVNLAVELNGQLPLQAYVKPCRDYHVILRSIDLGASECVETYEELSQYNKVGSPFSIPKAALTLAGFRPHVQYPTLREQLEAFGSGIELTMHSAVPAGSGLGTSSILAATVLGALNDFCSLGWDKSEIGHQTLMLEQLLTTGGGWQDQFGGVIGGVKLLQTEAGVLQQPTVRCLPDTLYTQPEYAQCHLLYYTGITRTAKTILGEIVRRMFLRQPEQLSLLRDMKQHTLDMYEAIQRNDFSEMGRLVRRTWMQNQRLDSGTNPPAIQALTTLVDDLCLGYKLPGAGGGGYLYMVAKDPAAAARIIQTLNEHRQNANAHFVNMTLSKKGLQVSRS